MQATTVMKPSHSDFCHPYEPYTIQLEFMEALYECIERRQIGIFESPTGTGKSLSLICGSLTWLRDNGRRKFNDDLRADIEDPDDPPWMIEAAAAERRRQLLQSRQELESQLAAIRSKEDQLQRTQSSRVQPRKRQRVGDLKSTAGEEEFMLADYESDDEDRNRAAVPGSDGLSAATALLLGKLQGPTSGRTEGEAPVETRIFYCSRTHSQLTQFVHELRRVKPPNVLEDEDGLTEPIKHISLGSRNNLCVNQNVASLKSTALINERCRELQKPGKSTEDKCKYLPARDETMRWTGFRDHALARIRDIEDLAEVGRRLEVCPYYASRISVPSSEIITLPYPLLLQKSARETLKLVLKDQVVIIDEAHNLMDAIANANSAAVYLDQLDRSIAQLTNYAQAFKNRLKGKNRAYVTQILRLLHSVVSCVKKKLVSQVKGEHIVSGNDLMSGKGVDQINPHKLSVYLQESKLALKVEGFARSRKEKEGRDRDTASIVRSDDLTTAQSFLLCLMNPSAEGIFYLSADDGNPRLRYALLDPKHHFRDIVEDARAVILAGGTMSPMSDYADYLFPYAPKERLAMHTFGHVIPSSNLIALSLGRGSGNSELEFTFEKRKSTTIMDEVGATILDICRKVPDGVVVFFPSYEYLRLVTESWKRSAGADSSVFQRLSQSKPMFWETKDQAASGDLFQRYAESVAGGNGGLLLSVVGGKLSEGINFSDALGRAVIMVGLPFPNAQSAEWRAKIEYVEKAQRVRLSANTALAGADCEIQAKAAGREFYENACMRAVNQCIGRAIRHRNDYAAIILMDRRYRMPRIQDKLPAWIRQTMTQDQDHWPFKTVTQALQTFFEAKTKGM